MTKTVYELAQRGSRHESSYSPSPTDSCTSVMAGEALLPKSLQDDKPLTSNIMRIFPYWQTTKNLGRSTERRLHPTDKLSARFRASEQSILLQPRSSAVQLVEWVHHCAGPYLPRLDSSPVLDLRIFGHLNLCGILPLTNQFVLWSQTAAVRS